jgi:hypothetical protein
MSTTRRRSPTGRTFRGGIGKRPVPFITKALRPRRPKRSPFVEELTKAARIIVRHGPLAPRITKIRGWPGKWGAFTAEAVHRMLTEERYADDLAAAVAASAVDRDHRPLVRLVTRAADAARKQHLTDTAKASATSVDLTNAHKMDSYTDSPSRTEAPDVAAERQQGAEEYNQRVLEWYGTLQGERERKTLTLLLSDPRPSDREIERLTGASRERVVSPMRRQLDRLKAERLVGSPIVSTPNAPDVEEPNVAEAPTELDNDGDPADLTGEFKEVNTVAALAPGEAVDVRGGHRASAAHAPGESAQFDARDKMDRGDSANYRGGKSRRGALFAGESMKWNSKDGGGPRPSEGALLSGADRPSWNTMLEAPRSTMTDLESDRLAESGIERALRAALEAAQPAPAEPAAPWNPSAAGLSASVDGISTHSHRAPLPAAPTKQSRGGGGWSSKQLRKERVAAYHEYAAAGAERDKQRRLRAVADAAAADRDAKRLRADALVRAANDAVADERDADKTAQLAKFAARARITLPELRRIVDQLERDNPDVSLDWLLGMALKGEAA